MKGVDKLYKRIKALADIRDDIVDEISETATNIELGATRDIPIGDKKLIASMIVKKASNGGLVQTIQVNAGELGAYFEFGTGQSAAQLVPTLPDEFQKIAERFIKNKQGRLIAHPYFYPNYARYTNGLEGRLLKILKDAKDGK